MMQNNLSPLKSIFRNPYLKYMGIFLLVILITISLDITYFANNLANEPNISAKASLDNPPSESLKSIKSHFDCDRTDQGGVRASGKTARCIHHDR